MKDSGSLSEETDEEEVKDTARSKREKAWRWESMF